ncbi:MAG TPA: GNAT family N-acetyltransferase [Desulfuromonadales bacterium]|jgi:ribosomal protein S18 acetylase RimI-like enzyme|nr:GNAT family N-acetyltransferase [Desulfuromonadales bacterium]
MKEIISIRDAIATDLDAVVTLGLVASQSRKPGFWSNVFDHYVLRDKIDRFFLVAESGNSIVGFIIGEVRAWEFGSPPCGWVFALAVLPEKRQLGIGQQMFEEIAQRLKQAGVTTVRTMVDRDDKLTLSFFRGLGLCTGKYLELEKQID